MDSHCLLKVKLIKLKLIALSICMKISLIINVSLILLLNIAAFSNTQLDSTNINISDSSQLSSITALINYWIDDPELDWINVEYKVDSLNKFYKNKNGSISLSNSLIIHKKGVIKFYQGLNNNLEAFFEAIKYYKKALKYREKIQANTNMDLTADIINGCSNIGECYIYIDKPDEAVKFLEKGISIAETHREFEEYYDIYLNLFYHLGQVFIQFGDYDNAIEYFKKIIDYNHFTNKPDELFIVNLRKTLALNECGNLFAKFLYNPLAARKFLIQAGNLAIKNDDLYNLAIYYRNMGIVYFQLEEFDSSIYLSKKSLEICKKISYKGIEADNYVNLAAAYNKVLNFDKAYSFLKLAEELYKEIGRDYNLSLVYDNQADRSFLLGNYIESLKFNNLDISCLINDFQPSEVFSNPTIKDKLIADKEGLVYSLNSKAKTFLHLYQHEGGEEKYLKAAYETFSLADKVISLWRSEFQAEASRMSLAKYTKPIYEKAIETCFELYQINQEDSILNKAFEYSEKSRAIVLLDAVRRTKASAHVDQQLISKERDLNLKVNYFEKKAALQELDEENRTTYNVYDSVLYYRRQHQAVIDQIKETTPEYHNLIFEQSTVKLQQLKKALDEDQSFIEYFVGDSSFYTFLVNKDKTLFLKNDHPDSVRNWVSDWVSKMPQLDLSFIEPSNKLYQSLISPMTGNLKPRIVIAADDVLNLLNFESLVTELPNSERIYLPEFNNYLIHNKQISYAFSASTLLETSTKKRLNKSQYLGVAPELQAGFYIKSNWFDKLDHNNEEIVETSKLFKNKNLVHSSSAKSSFLQLASSHNLIHCATHALANNEDGDLSFIVFGEDESDILYAKDLYALDLNADLVVLSACQTNAGELNRGEGVISLARSFTYAGAASIVTSLWNVREKTNKEIIYHFYQYLKEGFGKDKALRKAKLDYLSSVTRENEAQAHPYFWAPLVIIGDTSPTAPELHFSTKIIVAISILTFLLLVYFLKKRIRNLIH